MKDPPVRAGMCGCIGGTAPLSLGRLGAQQSLNSRIDVSTSGDEGLEVGLTVDEAHGVQLLQLLLKSHFRTLRLREGGRQDLREDLQPRDAGPHIPSC